jgi:hypothetical protein
MLAHQLSRYVLFLFGPTIVISLYKTPPFLSLLNKINQSHTLPSYSFTSILILSSPFILRSSEWSLSFRFPTPKPCMYFCFPHTCHMPHPHPTPSLDNHGNISRAITLTKFLIIQLPPVSPFFVPECPTQHNTLSLYLYYFVK